MKLISLELREWRAYENEFIEFPDGVIGVAGLNGAGKSTIAEAIGWALFGKLRKGQKQSSIRRQGGEGRPTAELKFRMGDAIYTVRRIAGGECNLWVGDDGSDPEASGARNVNAKIARELDLTWDLFRRTVFAEQKDIAALDPGTTGPQRRAHVERLLGLTRYKVAAESARRDARAIEQEIKGQLLQVADPGELKEELAAAERAAEAESPAVAKAEAAFEKAKKKYADARAKAQQEQKRVNAAVTADARRDKAAGLAAGFEDQEKETRTAIQARDQRAARLREIEKDAAKAPDAEQAARAWQALADAERELHAAQAAVDELGYDDVAAQDDEKKLDSLEREQKKLETERAGLERELEQVGRRVAVLEEAKEAGDVSALKTAVAELEALDRTIQKRAVVLRSRLDEDRDHVRAVEEGGPGTPCPVCKKPYGDEHEQILADYRERIVTAERDLPALEAEATELSARLDDAREKFTRAREAGRAVEKAEGPATLSGARTALDRAEQRLRAAVERLEVLEEELPPLRLRVRKSQEAAREWSAKKALLKDRQTSQQNALKALGGAKYSDEAHGGATAEAERLGTLAREADELRQRVADTAGLESQLAERHRKGNEYRDAEKAAVDELKALNVKPEKIEKLQSEVETLQERCNRAEQDRDDARERFDDAKEEARDRNEEVKRLRENLKAAEKAHAGIAERLAEQKRHQAVAEILEQYRAHEAKRAWPRLEISAAELLSAATDGRYADVRLSEEDFQLTISDRGEHHALGRYSGGEQDLANLCLRLAIAEWVANERGVDLSLLILDEVFGSQDDERRHRLLDQLRNLSRRFGQMLIITHVPEVAEMCDARIEVRLKSEGTSEAKVAG